MSTQETGARRRSRLTAALAALALTAAVLVLATQANSISSTSIGPQVPRVPVQTALGTSPLLRASSHTPVSCPRRTYGCEHRLRASSHIAVGCRRPKYGCQQGGGGRSVWPSP
jgi:hypothetical protein